MNEEHTEDCARCKEYLDGWKRAQADYANLKKEMERQKLESSLFGKELVFSQLLPFVDHFTGAVARIPDLSELPEENRIKIENWFAGIRAIDAELEKTMQSFGLERVDATGSFDPSQHEAISEVIVEGKEPGEIAEVVQDGWKLQGKLLQPAKVIISKATF